MIRSIPVIGSISIMRSISVIQSTYQINRDLTWYDVNVTVLAVMDWELSSISCEIPFHFNILREDKIKK